jgi:spermidine synthase
MTTRIPVGVFFALFTISGFAGLIYQSIWSHYLKLFLGHAAYAQTLVLAIFMGGMAIGSWLVGRYTHRIRNLLLGYAAAEFAIGVLAILFHRVFVGATGWAFDSVLPAIGDPVGVDLFKWTLASMLILPASILLGTTFPLMSAGLIRLYPQSSGRALSMLYFTNSLGAVFGVLASGFALIRSLGLPGTILTSGIMNIALAIVVWGLTKRLPAVEMPVPLAGDASQASPPRPIYKVVLALAFVTGAASFIYEITWIRMLSLGLGASTHAFEVMLAAFILGMSMGALFLRNRVASTRNDLAWLAGILVAKGLLAIYAIGVYGSVLEFIVWVMHAVDRTSGGYVLITAAGLVTSMLVMFPAAFCAGMTLPLATQALIARGFGEASIGKVYGANTAGCIVGAAFTTHVGMELLGLKGLTGLGAAMDVLAGVALIAVARRALDGRGYRWANRAFVAAGVVAIVSYSLVTLDPLKLSSGIFRYGAFLNPKDNVVDYYRDGKTATVSVTRSGTLLSIRTNGKPDAGVQLSDDQSAQSDEATMMFLGILPLAYKPDLKDAAVIGFGSGMSTHWLLGSPSLRVVDTIEIEPAMVEGAKAFGKRNARAYSDPRSRVTIADAKTYFAAHNRQYDVIVSEPSNPWVSGVSTLFSEEFYKQVRNYLRDDGLLVQWIQAYEINFDLISTILKAMGPHVGDYRMFFASSGDLVVVATKSGKMPPLRDAFLRFPLVAAEVNRLGYYTVDDFRMSQVGSRSTLEPLVASTGIPANSDYFPILDQNASRTRFMGERSVELRTLGHGPIPFVELIEQDDRYPPGEVDQGQKAVNPRRLQMFEAREAARIFLTGESTGTRLAEPDRLQFLFVHAGLDDCQIPRTIWLKSLTELLTKTSPYLPPVEVAAILQRADKSKCAKDYSDEDREWLRMIFAIAIRDARTMGDAAQRLLSIGKYWVTADRSTLILAGMAGHLASGNRDKAKAIWESQVKFMGDEPPKRILTRLLLAHAGVTPTPAGE